MRKVQDTINEARLIRNLNTIITTGDLEYESNAMEVRDENGEEILHIVLDASGEQQVLFFPHAANYRIPLSVLEELLAAAGSRVRVKE